ncbi:MAG: GHKL domain-containing protein [Dorea sp.]|jgi:two-component system sensor histidine kinase AgrC|nr:GHKL domain-containing protein [Dorea sp.]
MKICVGLVQFTGVLLQTIPVMTLVGGLFDEEEFRRKKRDYYIGGSLALILLAAVFAVIYSLKDIKDIRRIIGDSLMTAIIGLFCLYFFYIVQSKFIKKLIVVGIGCSYATVVYLVSGLFVLHQCGVKYYEEPYFRENLIGLTLATLVTYPLIYLYLVKIVKPILQMIDDRMLRRQCVSVMMGLLFFCVESRVMLFGDFYYTLSNVAAVIGIVAVMYYLFFNEVRLMQEHYEMQRQMDNFDRQSKNIGKNIEEMKRMHHNIHHHLNVIGILNQQGKQREITEYLSQYEKTYTKLESQRLTGYMILDSVLRYYLQEMEEEQIKVQTNFQIGSSYRFEPMDITVLFGNCLENAIEEQRRLQVEERYVGIDVRVNGQFLMISMKNKCMAGIVRKGEFADFRKFPSSKRSSGKGEGLHSIDIIARKYKGNARFQRSESWFVMHVILQIP